MARENNLKKPLTTIVVIDYKESQRIVTFGFNEKRPIELPKRNEALGRHAKNNQKGSPKMRNTMQRGSGFLNEMILHPKLVTLSPGVIMENLLTT